MAEVHRRRNEPLIARILEDHANAVDLIQHRRHAAWLTLVAGRQLGAEPYDIPDARFSHVGDQCSFDAFIRHFELRAPGLVHLAAIVRGADTARPELAAQAPGLLAISLGLSANYPDDHAMLAQGMTLYDALYAWCRSAGTEAHDWKPTTMEIRP